MSRGYNMNTLTSWMKRFEANLKHGVSLNSLFFKHESFSTEEEYRYVAVVPTENIKILSYNNGKWIKCANV